jgi:aspartate racemase
MTRVGLVGGIGPESTIDYYRLLIAAGRTAIVIDSIDVARLVGWMTRNELPPAADYLVASLQRLAAAGAEVAIICANTPHIVFDEVQHRSPIPLVSIVEAVGDHVAALGLRRAALFGTRFTMQASFYPEVFARRGLTIALPNQDEQTVIHDKYLGELLKGQFLPATRSAILAIVDAMVARDGIEAVILGGTELPILLREPSHAGIPLLDTTRIHVDALLRYDGAVPA